MFLLMETQGSEKLGTSFFLHIFYFLTDLISIMTLFQEVCISDIY